MTNRQLTGFLWMVFLFLIQETFSDVFWRLHPPLLLIGVIFYAMTEGPIFGAVIGCFAGFLLDILGVGKLGISMAIFALIGALSGFSSAKIFYDSLFTQISLPVLGQFFVCLVNLFFVKAPAGPEILKEAFFMSQPWLVVLVSPAVFLFLKKISFVRHERRKTRMIR